MRILHTADWHLGRIFHNVPLTDDQAHVLEQFCALARETRPDAIIIAGDVFDRAVPSQEAIALWDETLTRLARETAAHIVVIAGNHDSPQRLGQHARLLADNRVHLATHFTPHPAPIVLEDAHGPVLLFPLPYAEPAQARAITENDALRAHADVLALLMDHVREQARGARCVVAAHATVAGGEASESERPLSIGGAEAVPPETFAGAHYVALGHLHRPQSAGAEHIRYAGSLLKYSFAEADHAKSISLVELDATGTITIEPVALTPRRDVRRLSGTLEELLAAASHDPAPEDYLQVELTDPQPVYNAMERLREVYPNVLEVRRPALERLIDSQAPSARAMVRTAPLELFCAFVRDMTGEEPDDAQRALLAEVVEDIERARREAEA